MRYPLDNQGIDDIVRDILLHHRAQIQTIGKLIGLFEEILSDADPDSDWYDEVQDIVKEHRQRQMDFENHRFNQKNGHFTDTNSPYPAEPSEHIGPITLQKENELNAAEKEFGPEMTEQEIANLFREKTPKKEKKKKQKKLNKMSIEEIENWEKAQDNSNDIYKVSARIKNLARGAVKGNLTAQGDMLANSFTHLIKAFYDFAETIPDKETRIRLTQLARKQEETPANLIAALTAGVKAPK